MTKSPYSITLEVNAGETYKAKGDTVHEALSALGLDFTQVKTKGVFTLKHGTKTSTKFYYLPQLRRIVANKLRKVQVAKDLLFLLK